MKRIGIHLLLLCLSLSLTGNSQENDDAKQDGALWLRDPAISPDGEWIAFTYKGDIYLVPADGGEAELLVQHEAYDKKPVWSPSGEQIAFASDRNGDFDIFVLSVNDATLERVSYHSEDDRPYAFTPDGDSVLFSSRRMDDVNSAIFPHRVLTELYKAPTDGGRVRQVLTSPAQELAFNEAGDRLLYHDRKGYENRWRKHHRSSVTRDIWSYDRKSGEHTKLTDFEGEDRDPSWHPEEEAFYYLSERSGDLNVWRMSLDGNDAPQQVTDFSDHPVRFLSIAGDGTLCFGFDGAIYTHSGEGDAEEVPVRIRSGKKKEDKELVPIKGRVKEIALSPNGKEIAFIDRGEVFVTSIDHSTTKRITNTPEAERSVRFHPDGRKLVYASERDGSWNVYEASIKRGAESYFHMATVIEEDTLIANDKETFQPAYSPDGKEVAFLEERTTLRVLDTETGEQRTVLPGHYNYSYQDGDQWYQWAPDGNWFLVKFIDNNIWPPAEVGLVAADGRSEPINLTESGFNDVRPMWMMDGKMMLWLSDQHGKKNYGGLGESQMDAFGMFFDKEAYDRFLMKEPEYALEKEERAREKEKKESGPDEGEKGEKPLDLNLQNKEDRVERLTLHSSNLADATVGPKGEKLYYLSEYEKGFGLWVNEFHKDKTRLLAHVGEKASELILSEKGKSIFVLAKGRILKIDAASGQKKPVKFKGEMELDKAAQRAYLFEHVWRQTREKFYVKDMHGVDWEFYKKAYQKFLPHINNSRDLAELLSEMLGELNASHTGCRFRNQEKMGDRTASLGVFFDRDYRGSGLRVAEVMDGNPVLPPDTRIEQGVVIESIEGQVIEPGMNFYPLLNRKGGDKVLLSLYDPETDERWEEVVEPIELKEQRELLYERWVDRNREKVDTMSDSTLGYVHVKGMNDPSFRKVFKNVFGRHHEKDALIVDTRFNGGGWLHDDLATMLDGKTYLHFSPRGQENLGGEPVTRWTKPSAVLMSEGNYSDAFMFPYVYKHMDIGELIGMPVPGTGTAVWWEQLLDPRLVFGIPQVGMKTLEGNYLENNQLEPDIRVPARPPKINKGVDEQLRRAVDHLMEDKD